MTDSKSGNGSVNESGYEASSGEKKVVAVARAAEIPGVLDRLVELKSRSDDPYSLRRLATYFNVRLVEATLARHGADIDSEMARSLYEVLTADDPDPLKLKNAKSTLEVNDVDVDRLYNDFVSYHAINTYLSDVDGVDVSHSSQSDAEREAALYERLAKLEGRVSLVTEGTLETATNAGLLVYDEVPSNVEVSITADCPECGRTQPVFDLFGSGCVCQSRSSAEQDEGESAVSVDSAD